MLGDIRDHAIYGFRERAPRLVAVGAQIALATVISRAFDCVERHRIGGLKSEVSGGEAGVDLVAGTAILAGWMRVPLFNLARAQSCINSGAESSARVTARAACTGPPQKGCPCPVQ